MSTRATIAAIVATGISLAAATLPALADSAQPDVLVYKASFFADARPNTAYDMVQRLPGFAFDDGGTARGFAGNAGNVVIDGERPTSKTDDLQSILTRIPASDVARIEVIRGAVTGIDMHGQTVIANVIRKENESTSIVAQANDNIWPDGHTIPSLRMEYARHADGWLYEGAIERTGNYDDSVGNGFRRITDATGTTRYHAHTSGHGAGWNVTGAVTMPLWDGQFKINGTFQDKPFYGAVVYTRPSYRLLVSDRSGNHNGELGLHWAGELGDVHLETLVLQRIGQQTDLNLYDAPGDVEQFSSDNDTGETIARATFRYSPFDDLTLQTGAEGAYNFLDGHTAYAANGVSIPLPSANARVEEQRGEIFTEGTWKISPEWSFEAGARFEFSTISETGDTQKSRSFFYPKPRAVLSWTPDPKSQVRLRVERVVGQLDFGNFVATSDLGATGVSAGNPEIRPDQRMQYAVSYERHFWDKGAAVLTFLHEEITDVVDLVPIFTPTTAFDAPGNIGNGTNDEIHVELTLPLDKIGIKNGLISATNIWRISNVRDPLTGEPRRISVQRPQDIEIHFSQDIDSVKSTWGINFFDGWDESTYRLNLYQHRRVAPPYLEVYWEYKPTPDWSLRAEVDNFVPFVYERRLESYAGPRDSTPLVTSELRQIQSQPRLFIQVRKSFG